MFLIPLYTTLKDRRVLVVGGGDIAERKIRLLLQAGAHICVVAPAISKAVESLEHSNQIDLIRQPFSPCFLDDVWFVIAATDLSHINVQVAQAAQARRIFVNVVDDPALSSVQIPAIIDRSPLVISVSSSGAAPMIARHVREQVEALVDDAMGKLTLLSQKYRPQIQQKLHDLPERRRFYEWLIRGPVLQHLRAGNETLAAQCLEHALLKEHSPNPGHTIFITITSDDPGDITLRTLRVLNQADIIFHDVRIHPGILSLARRDADRHSFTLTEPDASVPDSVLQILPTYVNAGKSSVIMTRTFPGLSASGPDPQAEYTPPTFTPEPHPSGMPVIS